MLGAGGSQRPESKTKTEELWSGGEKGCVVISFLSRVASVKTGDVLFHSFNVFPFRKKKVN